MTGWDDKMPSVLVLELRGRPSLRRTTSPMMWDIFWYGTVSAYIGPPGMMGDGRGRRKTSENIGKHRKTAGDGGGRHNVVRPSPWLLLVGQIQKMTRRDDTMSSVLVLCSNLSGKFWKRRDGTTKCRPSSSWPMTDGLPRCEHWSLPCARVRKHLPWCGHMHRPWY